MFERSNLLINQNDLNKKILLVGLGGVGGASFEMLIRLGFRNITVIDYDIFEESNLNRQALSTINNIGCLKTNEAYLRAKNINENSDITLINRKLDIDVISELDTNYDYIIDAIDDVNAKVLLIKYAIKNDIKIISSMGTGNRVDPSKLEITNIWKTNNDPLARKLRYLLRKEKINYKLPVVSSSEIPIKSEEYISSICLVPNCAGIYLVSFIINDILKK